MGAGIKRETVGDICVGKGSCDFFLLDEMAPYVLQNLLSAGRTRPRPGESPLEEAQIPVPELEVIRGTLASLPSDSRHPLAG
ncbi:MAG: YlmH/Sll1252 family protein [Oscillospiraceae bacterium]